jgi:hypothetical protein
MGIRFKQISLKGFLRLDLQPVQLISPAARARRAARPARAKKSREKIHQPSEDITTATARKFRRTLVMEGHFEFTIRVAHTVKISACA